MMGETYNLEEMDLSVPFTDTQKFVTPEGETVTITNTFTPAPANRGSSSYTATQGTWTSTMSYGIFSMWYKYDLSKNANGGWKISNARDLGYSGAFTKVTSSSLKIGRASSTSSLPAEVSANCYISVFDNAWIHIFNGTYTLSVTVNHTGTLTMKY